MEESGGGRHYYLPQRIRKGFMEQVTVQLIFEHMQIRGKVSKSKKKKRVEKCTVL